MKICFLTQTAHNLSDYYNKFFDNYDLFFITFKSINPKAIGFLPKSTWSDGRNALWESVKNKYDYYVFIDDDLRFFNFERKVSFSALFGYIYHKLYRKNFTSLYEESTSEYFLNKLKNYLVNYRPEVLSITQLNAIPTASLDTAAMRKNSFVRRVGFFDAQFTVLSNYAANKLLPYDNSISGWWSAQIPIYLYSFHVFASKAINISELAVSNQFHTGAYVENYNGVLDCKKMILEISKVTGKDYSALGSRNENEAVDFLYGKNTINGYIPQLNNIENYHINYIKNLKGIDKLLSASANI